MIYYGYKRGDDDKIVDWSSVTKSLTDRIDEVEAKRAANRERIEGEIADATQKISDVPMGNYENMNSFMIQTSTDMAENLRVNSALLRAGKMKSSEFAKFRQNSLDAIGQYKKIAENYNSLRDKGVVRLNEGKSGWQEAYELERLEKLADLTRTVSVQDPITGTMFNAPIGEDGRPDMSQAESTLYLANMPFVEIDKFDMNAQLDPTVEKYGKNVEVIKSLGVNTKSSIKIRKDFEDSVNTFVGSFDSRQLASVLGDFIGGYKGTTDEDLAKSKPEEYILIGRDGSNGNFPTYKLTPEQETKAREAIKEQLYMKLDYVETPMATTAPSSTQQKRDGRVESAKGNMNLMAKLFQATSPSEVNEVLATYKKQLTGSVKGFKEARVVGNELVIEYDNPEYVQYETGPKTLEQKIPMPENFREFVETVGPALTGNQDLIELYDEAIIAVDNVEGLTRGGATGAFKITSPLPEFSEKEDAIIGQFDYFDRYSSSASRNENYISVADKYFEEFGIDGEASVSDDGVMTITSNGITETVKLQDESGNELRSTRRTELKNALKRIHDKLRKGATAAGRGAGNKLSWADWKSQNPNGTFAEYNEYKNQ